MAFYNLIFDNNSYNYNLVGGDLTHNQMVNKFNSIKRELIPTIKGNIANEQLSTLSNKFIRGYMMENNEYYLAIFIFSNNTTINVLYNPTKWAFSYVGKNKDPNINLLENFRLESLFTSNIANIASSMLTNKPVSSNVANIASSMLTNKPIAQNVANIASSVLTNKPIAQNVANIASSMLTNKRKNKK